MQSRLYVGKAAIPIVGAELASCAIKTDYNGPPDLKERFSFDEEFLVSKKEPIEHSRSLDMFGVD